MRKKKQMTSEDFSAEELFESLYKDSKTLVCLIKEDKVLDLNNKCITSFGYEVTDCLNETLLSDTISLVPSIADTYFFDAKTKKGLKFCGKVLKSIPTNDGFYFGFIEILYIDGLDTYAVSIDKVLKTLENMKEMQCPVA